MGQKVSPVGLRVGIIRDWDAAWYAEKTQVADLLHEDLFIRKFLENTYKKAQVSRVIIERLKGVGKDNKDRVKITLFTARPGSVIGRDGEAKASVVSKLEYKTKKEIVINVVEIKRPELDALLVAQNIAEQLEARASFRRVQKVAIQRALKAGAKGVKTSISGRLAGAEMARSEGYIEGQVPLHTLRADIDYATAEALTTYGKLGVKVWIYKGDSLGLNQAKHPSFNNDERKARRPKLPQTNKEGAKEEKVLRKPRVAKKEAPQAENQDSKGGK